MFWDISWICKRDIHGEPWISIGELYWISYMEILFGDVWDILGYPWISYLDIFFRRSL
jgi:hypothetical protein